jgi:hypothetical protein
VTPSSAISPDLDRKLRNTIVELLQILNKGDCPAFVEFQRVRGQQDYDEKYLGNVGKYLRLDASQPIDRLYAQIWKTAYSSGLSGYQSSGFDNMCTTETTLEVFKKPPDLSIAKVIGPREEAATENELGSVGGTLSLRSKVDPETSKAADVALFHAVIRPKDSDPAYPWYFVFEYQPDVGQWVLMSYMTTLTDYKLKYFPFL